MKFTSSLRRRQLAKTFGLFLCLFSLTSQPAKAQSTGTPLAQSPGSPAGSYPLSEIDTVNLFNGRINVRIPVVTARGRGKAGGQITYNWGSPANYHIRTEIDPNNGSQINYVEPGGGGAFSIDGLSTGFAQVYGVQGGNEITTHCWMGDYYTYQKTLTRMFFVEPDGTEHEMRDVQTGGQAFSVPACALNGSSRGKVFVSTDGSGATFIADAPVVDYVYAGGDPQLIGPPGFLLLSDGTRYRVNDGTVMRDRNGNLLSNTFEPFPVFQYKIKDSLNRQTVHHLSTACPPPLSGNCQKLSYKGFNGATRDIVLTGTNPVRLILPNGLDYKFHINGYGDLTRIDLPTGGWIEYDYGPGIGGPQPDPYAWIQGLQGAIPGTYPLGAGPGIVYRRVTERRVYREGNVLESRQTFSKPEYYDGSSMTPANQGYVEKKQYDGSSNLISTERHFFFGAATNSYQVGGVEYSSWKEGREYHSEIYNQSGTLVRQSNLSWEQRAAVPWWGGSSDAAPQNDPRLSQSSTVLENGQSTTTTYTYDPLVPYNSLTDVHVFDYGGGLLNRKQTSYVKTLNGTDYAGINITNPNLPYMRELPLQVSVFDGGGERGRTTFEYDNYAVDSNHAPLVSRTSISGLDASFSPSYSFRGNVTKVTSFLLTNGTVTGSTARYTQYDVAGNVVKEIDPRGYATTFTFTDTFGGPNGDARINSAPLELSSVAQISYGFPTLITNALNHTTYTQFDYYTGQPVDLENPNGVTDSAAFDDPLDRQTQLIRAANQSTSVKSQRIFSYNDSSRIVTSTSDLSSFADSNPLKTQTVYDSLGRKIENREYEGGSNYIVTQIQYDALGRAHKNSNPFRPWQGESAVWTTTAFDALGRVISVTTPDNAVASTSYSGNSTTTTDPAGKARKSVADALGRVTSVFEDPNGLNYQTSYGYDGLDNLTTVTQGVQTRSFVYDSLKRLTSTTSPESGTTTYQYDANGNMTQKTDARGVSSTYVYDALNRNTSIDYSDATPDVFKQYDQAVKGVGRINQTWQSGTKTSATNIDSYDALGRPLIMRQRYETSGVWSASYQTTRTYNQAGGVTSQTYPSGRTVTYSYDAAGRASGFTGNLGDGTNRNYATNLSYSSFGEISREDFGTTTPLYHKSLYNIRGQLFDTRLSSVNDLWDWNRGRLIFYYSGNHAWGQSGTDNNGNVRFAETWIPPENATLDQVDMLIEDIYSYDSLNRLTSVAEQQISVAGGWVWQQQFRQQYTYDRYGNRTIDASQTWGTGINITPFTVLTASNRLGVPAGLPWVMNYDAAGNLITDTYTGVGTRTYDAENRMSTSADYTGQVSRYTYDGDGRRVRRQVASSQEEWLIYGMDGELLAEYPAGAATTAPAKEYGYRNGELLITASGRFNVAAAANGAVATASTTATGSGFSTFGAINGNNRGPWGNGEGWNDNTPNVVPDWLQIDFAGSKTIDEIDVFSLHDNYPQENTPTLTQTFSLYGLLAFDVQYWNGSSWVTVPGGSVTGNNKVWRKFTFSPITTSKIRVMINSVPDAWSRVVEIQAFGTSAGGEKIQWLVTDHLGTPRMVIDQTGSLANISRHDYLPFGEELFAPTGGRSAGRGYKALDGVRQQFTAKERDDETGLDYFGARYYASVQGRFTSADPIHFQKEMVGDPQRFNLYAYVRNNPLRFIDPTGEAIELLGTEEERRQILNIIKEMVGKKAGAYLYENTVTQSDGSVKYFVGVRDASPGQKDFKDQNEVAGELKPIIDDKKVVGIQIVSPNTNVGNGFVVAPNNVSGYANAYAATIKKDDNHWVISLPIPKAGTVSAEKGLDPVLATKMDDNKPGKRTWAILLGHELGHARGRMTDPFNVAHSNASSLRLEDKVKKLRYPGTNKRVHH